MTSTPSAAYSPGSWVAASSVAAWLLVDLGLDDPRLTACWSALAAEDPDQVLDVLLGGGLGKLPGFAVVVSRPSGTRVVARHPAVVTCRRDGQEPTVVTSAEGRTWTDVELPGQYDEIVLAAGLVADEGLRLPLAHGITPAGLLCVGGAPGPVAAPLPAGSPDATVDTAPAPATEARPEASPGASPEAAAQEPAIPADSPAGPWAASLPEADDEIGGPAEETTEVAGSSYYGRLLGATVDRDALLAQLSDAEEEDAPAVPPAADEDSPVASGHTAIWQPDGSVDPSGDEAVAEPEQPIAAAPAPTPTPTPADVTADVTGGVIDGVPWATGSPAGPPTAPPAEPTPVVVSPGFSAPVPAFRPPIGPVAEAPADATPATAAVPAPSPVPDGTSETEVRTVNRAELLKSLAAPAATGPTVMAVRCPRAHLTSAYSAQCRVCGEAIEEQVPTEEPRPALGRLLLSTGETVILDRDVILGRAPESAEEDPALRPNLVRLTDSAEVSRMHVRVTLDGWQPMLRDLGSSNGTTLTLTSSSPQQLRPQEDYVLEPDCEVSLADVVSFRFEVTT